MADFKCSYIDNRGKLVKEVIASNDIDSLKLKLKSESKLLVDAKISRGLSNKQLAIFSYKKMLSSSDLSNLCRQLGIITSSGVSIIPSLETLMDQASNKLLKSELKRLYTGMQMGETMAEIMAEPGSHFPELLAGMVVTGESSGTLDKVFKSMADYYNRDNIIKKKIKSALIYPILLCCMAVVLIFVFMKFILPGLIDIISSSGNKLPATTQFVVSMANVIGNYWWLIAAVVIGIATVLKRWTKTKKGRIFKDALLIKIPVLNRAIKNVVIARFSQGLGLFVASGFPLVRGLELLLSTTHNAIAEISINEAIKGIQQGEGLSSNLAKGTFFDKLFIQMLAVGEQTGSLQTITKEMTEHYETETELSISRATALIEPIMMIIIGSIIGFIIVSVALPMFTIYNSIE